jgi:hypothetical protein
VTQESDHSLEAKGVIQRNYAVSSVEKTEGLDLTGSVAFNVSSETGRVKRIVPQRIDWGSCCGSGDATVCRCRPSLRSHD